MQAQHRYPVGVQVFEKIRLQGYLYADKTEYVWRMAHEAGGYYFLSRPRRFGKTLLVSTMEAYFQGRQELFRGLAIDRLEREWVRHPVIRLDLSDFKETEVADLKTKIGDLLAPFEATYGISNPSPLPSSRIDAIIRAAYAQTGEDVVVLVDEYDAPLLNVMHDPRRLQEFREIMRAFYAPLKKDEEYLRFVFLTGITKFSQLSIFSELNNLNNVSMDVAYAGVCGITAEELDGKLTPDVEALAGRMDVSADECRRELKRMYDGYRFSKAEDMEVYNPFSLISAFAKGEIAPYWFASGTPSVLVDMLREGDLSVPELEGIKVAVTEFDAPAEDMDNPVAFMYQSGYLTIKGYDKLLDAYALGIPNAEVSDGLYKALLPAYTGVGQLATGSFLMRFAGSLLRSHDAEGAMRQLQAFLAGIPYDMAPKSEKDFQTVLYLVLELMGAYVQTEVRVATGRIDAVVDAGAVVYVIELKYRRTGKSTPTSADAMRQIDERGYAAPYVGRGKRVVKVGVCYSEEKRTLDEGWVIR